MCLPNALKWQSILVSPQPDLQMQSQSQSETCSKIIKTAAMHTLYRLRADHARESWPFTLMGALTLFAICYFERQRHRQRQLSWDCCVPHNNEYLTLSDGRYCGLQSYLWLKVCSAYLQAQLGLSAAQKAALKQVHRRLVDQLLNVTAERFHVSAMLKVHA